MNDRVLRTALFDLLLRHGRSYDSIAAFLGQPADELRRMARVMLVDLVGHAESGLDAARRERIAACLLGQQSPAERAVTISEIRSSKAARAWTVAALDVLVPYVSPARLQPGARAASTGGLGGAQDFRAGARILHERIAAAGDRTETPNWDRLIAPSRRGRGSRFDRWRRALGVGRRR